MGYNLRILFEGAVALVPDRPLFEFDYICQIWKPSAVPPQVVDVLFPDLSQAEVVDLDPLEPRAIRDAHHAAFTFPWASLRPTSTRVVDVRVASGRPVSDQGIVLLERECVRLRLDPSDLPGREIKVNNQVGSGELPDPDDPRDERSLWWVPALERINADSASVARVNDPRGAAFSHGDGARVAGAFLIEFGTLQVEGFNRDRASGDFNVWSFERPQDTNLLAGNMSSAVLRQSIGNRLVVEVRGLEKEVAFEFGIFSGGDLSVESEINLGPPHGFSDTVTVNFANRELDHLVRPFRRKEGRRSFWDADFHAFYEISSSPLPARESHLPTRPNGFLGPDERPCAPSLMSGYR